MLRNIYFGFYILKTIQDWFKSRFPNIIAKSFLWSQIKFFIQIISFQILNDFLLVPIINLVESDFPASITISKVLNAVYKTLDFRHAFRMCKKFCFRIHFCNSLYTHHYHHHEHGKIRADLDIFVSMKWYKSSQIFIWDENNFPAFNIIYCTYCIFRFAGVFDSTFTVTELFA